MREEYQLSSQELAVKESYRQAFWDVLASRGLSEASIRAIEQANCVPVIEAECDEEDGGINLPPDLEIAFFVPYGGIRAPQEQTQPVYVKNVFLGLNEGGIEIEPKLVHYTTAPEIEGFVTTKSGRAVSSSIYFDFNKGDYGVEVVRVDKDWKIINEGDPTIIEEHKLTPDMMTSLVSFLPEINAGQSSKVSIYRKPASEQNQIVST